jgi:small-conductance mechanosensitive channel
MTLPLAPDSLGAQLLVSAATFVTTMGQEVRQAVHAVRSLPLLWGWMEVMVTSPIARDFLIDAAWRALLALALAVAVQRGVRHLLRDTIQRLEEAGPSGQTAAQAVAAQAVSVTANDATARAEAGDIEPPPPEHRRASAVLTSLRRLPRLLARLGLELLPVLATAMAGHLFAASGLGGQSSSRLITLAVIDSYAVSTALLRVSRVLLLSSESRFALISAAPEASRRVILWIRRLVVGGIVGYAFGEVGFLLGMSPIAHAALQKAIGLYVVVILAILAIQNRRPIRRRLVAGPDEKGRLATIRNRLARIWHWIACVVLGGAWLIWVLERRDSRESILHTLLLTVLIVAIGRFGQLALHGILDKALASLEPEGSNFGILANRLRRYHQTLHTALSVAVNVVTVLAVMQLYGLGGLNWLLTTPLGQRFLSALGTVLVTIVLALMAWEAINAAIQSHLARLDREAVGNRAARLRTLLPLLRTTLVVTIGIMTGLMILSEIGVNIAPLLAGAGIIGIAIGFGSQKLVQDLITGVFLLLENAMQVGDVVKVGDLVGTVESLSVRTIRLRSEDGSVHVIPFSAVTTVTNMTREFSRAVITVMVAYDENYDRVVEILRGITQNMRQEPAWSGIILDDLEVFGLQEVDNIAMNIRCRIRCTAFGRWSVGREFNRRMKEAFTEHAIRRPEAPIPIRS